MKRFLTPLVAALMAGTLGLAATQPAKADGAASTRNIILGAAALVAGVAIESNVAHKNHIANAVTGYTPNGATVYQDGHVVLPNGQSYYPGNYGQTVSCSNQTCAIYGNGNTYSYGYGNGPGWYGN